MKLDLRTKATVFDGLVECDRDKGTEFIVYEPGNGTRYRLLTQYTGEFSEGSRDVLGLGKGHGYIVAFPDSTYRTLTYTAGSYLAPHWLRDKVGCTLADAVVLCELLAYLTDCQAMSCEEYQKEYGNG